MTKKDVFLKLFTMKSYYSKNEEFLKILLMNKGIGSYPGNVNEASHLNGAVVLIDLDAEFAAGCEVVRLGQVTLEAVVLHGVHVVLHTDQPPLVLGVLVLVARPDLLEVGHNVVTPESQALSSMFRGITASIHLSTTIWMLVPADLMRPQIWLWLISNTSWPLMLQM